MNNNSRAYNSVWQMRGDAWCRLEEAADRLTRSTTTGARRDEYLEICQQSFSRQILTFIRDLDTPEIHGYKPDVGYRVYTAKAIEVTGTGVQTPVVHTNGTRAEHHAVG